MHVSAAMLREALIPVANGIVNTIKNALDEKPPELYTDVSENGILLSGGGALMTGIDEFISAKLGVKVRVSRHPLYDVAIGLSHIITGGPETERYIFRRQR